MNNTYQEVIQQAWETYTQTQAKYRGEDYLKLLRPLYDTLNTQFGGVPNVITELGRQTPANNSALNSAEACFTAIQATLENMSSVFATFVTMDKKAITKAATLDQDALSKIYKGVEQADGELFSAFETTMFSGQEAAARAIGVYAAGPMPASQGLSKPK